MGADLLARQETMPFHIQVANPWCYRGLPMSPPVCFVRPPPLVSSTSTVPRSRYRRRDSEATFPVLSWYNKYQAQEKCIYFHEGRRRTGVKLRYYISSLLFLASSRTIIYILFFLFPSNLFFSLTFSCTFASLSARLKRT